MPCQIQPGVPAARGTPVEKPTMAQNGTIWHEKTKNFQPAAPAKEGIMQLEIPNAIALALGGT